MKSVFKILLLVGLCGTSLSGFNGNLDSFLVNVGSFVTQKFRLLFGIMPPSLSGQEYKEAFKLYLDEKARDEVEVYEVNSSFCQAGFAPACGFLTKAYLADELDKFNPKKAKELLIYAVNNTPDEPFVMVFRYWLDLANEMIEAGVKNAEEGYKITDDAFKRAYSLCNEGFGRPNFCFRANRLLLLSDMSSGKISRLMQETESEAGSLMMEYRDVKYKYTRE